MNLAFASLFQSPGTDPGQINLPALSPVARAKIERIYSNLKLVRRGAGNHGMGISLFLLPIAPCARTAHSLPAPARTFLFSPSLTIALCAKKKYKKSLLEETPLAPFCSLPVSLSLFALRKNIRKARGGGSKFTAQIDNRQYKTISFCCICVPQTFY